MEEEAEPGVSSRTERKAMEKAKILQRESDRKLVRLVRRGHKPNNFCFLQASRLRGASGSGEQQQSAQVTLVPRQVSLIGFLSVLFTEGRAGPEEAGGRAVGGGGRRVAAARRNRGGALQETSPQKCAEEEAGGGETYSNTPCLANWPGGISPAIVQNRVVEEPRSRLLVK